MWTIEKNYEIVRLLYLSTFFACEPKLKSYACKHKHDLSKREILIPLKRVEQKVCKTWLYAGISMRLLQQAKGRFLW